MSVEVLTVSNQHQLVDFCVFPGKIYSRSENPNNMSDPTSIFNPAHNPVLQHLDGCNFMAIKEGRAVGRVAATKDLLNPDPATGFFGCFECLNDPEAAAALLAKTREWLRENGCSRMVGPATFNTNQQVGMLVEGFENGYQYMMPYNPSYYPALMEAAGMEKLTDLLTFRWRREQGVPSRVAAAAGRAAGIAGVTLRRINLRHPAADVDLVRAVYNHSMAANWGFIPLTRAEVAAMLSYCAGSADPDLLLAVLVENKPAGILLCTPSPFPSRPGLKSVRAAIMGVVPEFRHRGLDSLMMQEVIKNLIKNGYHEADLSQVHEDNSIMLSIITRAFEGEFTRRFRIYQSAV